MRNQLLVLLLVFGLSHAADGGRAHAEDGDDFLFGDLGKIGRPLTEAARSRVNCLTRITPEVRRFPGAKS